MGPGARGACAPDKLRAAVCDAPTVSVSVRRDGQVFGKARSPHVAGSSRYPWRIVRAVS
jgi:hypothetical protein